MDSTMQDDSVDVNVDKMMGELKAELMTELDNEMGINDPNLMKNLNNPN